MRRIGGCIKLIFQLIAFIIVMSFLFDFIEEGLLSTGMDLQRAEETSLVAAFLLSIGSWVFWRNRRSRRNGKQGSEQTSKTDRENNSKLNLPLANYQDLPRLEAPSGYVYVIQDVSHSHQYKIGRTNYPARRLNKFDVVLPIDTRIIALLKTNNATKLENELHQRFGDYRTQGEWFNLNSKQFAEIRSMKPQARVRVG